MLSCGDCHNLRVTPSRFGDGFVLVRCRVANCISAELALKRNGTVELDSPFIAFQCDLFELAE